MSGGVTSKSEKKQQYFDKLKYCLNKYTKIIIVNADNVGSSQLQQIRKALRGSAEILMGKNTTVRKVLREYMKTDPKVGQLFGIVKNNVGFIFTNNDWDNVEKVLLQQRVGCAAKENTIAPNDVTIPAGPTGLEPIQTGGFAACNIPTKIIRSQIEICSPVNILKMGQRIGATEAAILKKLRIMPFTYGLEIVCFYQDGAVFSREVCCPSNDSLMVKFLGGLNNVASVALEIGFPTLASLPHVLTTAYKNVLSFAVETDYSFPAAEKIKQYIKDPVAYLALAKEETVATANENMNKNRKVNKGDDCDCNTKIVHEGDYCDCCDEPMFPSLFGDDEY